MPLIIVPSIDLRGGRVVRLKQGDYGQQINYDIDPLEVVSRFRRRRGQMDARCRSRRRQGRTPGADELIAKIIKATGLQVEVGGGIRSTNDIRRLIDAGANRAVVGTKAMEDWAWFAALAHEAEFCAQAGVGGGRQRGNDRNPRMDADVITPGDGCGAGSQRLAGRGIAIYGCGQGRNAARAKSASHASLPRRGKFPSSPAAGLGISITSVT